MTETASAAPETAEAGKPAKKAASKSAPRSGSRSAGLGSMLLADLKSMAAGLGIAGAGSMKKAQLVDAIKSVQDGGAQPKAEQAPAEQPRREQATAEQPSSAPAPAAEDPAPQTTVRTRTRKQRQAEQAEQRADRPADQPTDQPTDQDADQNAGQADQSAPRQRDRQQDRQQDKQQDRQQDRQQEKARQDKTDRQDRQDRQSRQDRQDRQEQGGNEQQQGQQQGQRQGKQSQQQAQQQHAQQQQAQQAQQQSQQQLDDDDDGEGGSRRNRRRRGRDRTPARAGGRNEPDTTILEDDVLVPAAGILDVLDNCAFVRTSGYLPGPEDVYLSLSMVRKYHLRRGDAVVGQVRQPREGERREKFNPMVRIDSVNGTEADGAKERAEFSDAVPVHPHQRLRLATDDANPTGRVIDIAAPVGKGQRGLILAPPRTGATSLLQSIAQSVTTNNPECHVMVVLVDTRPEEVTDFQRAVKGEVIASTFDRQPADHTLVAELAIERAKRLVELGHDVVVLLDSLTRLGRAYNLAAPANGRILGGVVDASAVHPTKEFFGAARKIEDGGSLTILAAVSVGTGSAIDEFFLEELTGTANLELVLSAERAARGILPAVDVTASGTRHEEKLLAPAEGAVVGDLRKQLAAADSAPAVAKVFGSR